MDDNVRPTSGIVEDNAEEIVEQFYGAEDAIARVVDEKENQFTLEVWYEGELRNDPRPFTYDNDDGRVQLFGVGEHISDNRVKIYTTISTPEAIDYDPDGALPVEPLVERYNLTPTSHDRVWVKNGSPDESTVEEGHRIADEFPVRVVVSQIDIMEKPVDWGYMSAYNLVTVSYESSLPSERTTEIIEELQEHFK